MPVCLDTSLLVKLYVSEPDSTAVLALVGSLREPIVFTDFHRAEFVTALHCKEGRKEITPAQLAKALADVNKDLQYGALVWMEVDWKRVLASTARLATAHAASTLCRTLDALHVALALHLKVRSLATKDHRQEQLALAVGLKVLKP